MKRFILSILSTALLMGCASFCWGQSLADTIYPISAAACPGSATAGVGVVYNGIPNVGTGLMVMTTPFSPVYQVQSTAAASTVTFTCEVVCPSRMAPTKGCSAVAGVGFFYGIQTTAATSQSATVCGTVTFPNPAATETPSTVAFVSVPCTTIPVVGSANLGLTTAGGYFTTYASITTPNALNGPLQKMFVTFAFGQTAAAAQVVNTPGGVIFTTNTITWLKKHPFERDVRELAAIFNSGQRQADPKVSAANRATVIEILASYGIRPQALRGSSSTDGAKHGAGNVERESEAAAL